MAHEESNRPKQIINKQLSEQGYSENATEAIRQWYIPIKKPDQIEPA
jgi:hypothetical protein